jgi:anaerobic ribonucleoside-triphosphate reductase activating protein
MPAGLPDAERLSVAGRVPRTCAEGPGVRYALWVQGCPMRCAGCCNPHLLDFREDLWESVEAAAAGILATDGIEGVTLLGGEPFAQASALAALSRAVRGAGLSVMVFSGYTLAQLREAGRADWDALLDATDLLVDGPYLPEHHSTLRRWIGSSNQRAHALSPRYRHLVGPDAAWPRGGNRIEIRLSGDALSVNGFPHPELTRLLQRP